MSESRRSSRVRTPSARLVQAAAGEFLASDSSIIDLRMAMLRAPPKPRLQKRRFDEHFEDSPEEQHSESNSDLPPPLEWLTPPPRVPEFQETSRDSMLPPASPEEPPPFPPSQTPLTPWLRGQGRTLTVGGRQLCTAVDAARTLEPDAGSPRVILAPYGCTGLELHTRFFSESEQARLLGKIGEMASGAERSMSALTPSVTDQSTKIFCCNPEQRELRGGRYKNCPLRSSCAPLIDMALDSGEDMNTVVTHLQPPADPFAVRRQLLCQQVAWHLEDLEPHCDRERQDKSTDRQRPMMDGVGDCIVSLTLRAPCWLLMRRTADHRDAFAIRLHPGDLYALTGDSRWKWQHGIMIETPPSGRQDCRVSMVWRILEEYPD